MEQFTLRNKVFKVVLILDLVLVNVVLGYLVYKFQSPIPKEQTTSNNQITNLKTEYLDKCGEECLKVIRLEVAKLEPSLPVATVSPTIITKVVKSKIRTVQYVTVPGSGYTSANSWSDVPGTDFYFDTKDYPGLLEVYFESTESLLNGNGVAYVRLFDVTHGIGVQGSDTQTSAQTAGVVTSGKVNFWSGRNLIRVQAKSLTADTAVYATGRLRIVTEN